MAASHQQPNVLFILADDLGWMDTSLYGSKYYKTPNIDTLMRRGMRFTNAYAANPLCSPTRSSIETGLWPARIGFTMPNGHIPQVVLEQTVPKQGGPKARLCEPNSVSRLKLDYFTLGEAFRQAGYETAHIGKWHLGAEPYDPLHQGYQIDIPHTPGPGPTSYFGPWNYPNYKGKKGEHIEDAMCSCACEFIKSHQHKPFYLAYWAFSVHAPFQAKEQYIERYRKIADDGNPQRNPIMAAMLVSFDQAVGKLMRTLRETGLEDNTIIVFMSDNGGMMYETPGGIVTTSNAPLRGGKATIYEGGTRVPFAVIWPKQIKPNSVNSTDIVQSIDIYPTLAEMCRLPLPKYPIDGISIVDALRGRKLRRDMIFCHFPHTVAATFSAAASYVREGDWKLVQVFCINNDGSDRLELYNLKRDIGETHDVAAKYPDVVKRLRAKLQTFYKNSHAKLPHMNPNYKP